MRKRMWTWTGLPCGPCRLKSFVSTREEWIHELNRRVDLNLRDCHF